MAIERIRQQKTPGTFGSEATGLQAPNLGNVSYVQRGVMDISKGVEAHGMAGAINTLAGGAAMAVTEAGNYHEGVQLATLEAQHEENINNYINSKPEQVAQNTVDAATLSQTSNSLWNKLGEGASIEDIDTVEKHFQDKLSTLSKANKQGVMTADEFTQRSLAITREAINRNPAYADSILAHSKRVLGLSGVEDFAKADAKSQEAAQANYQKVVDYHMGIAKAEDIPVTYDRYGNVDMNRLKAETDKAQLEKQAMTVITNQGTLRTAQDKQAAVDYMQRFGYQGANGILNEAGKNLRNLFANGASHQANMLTARQLYQGLKQRLREQAGPIAHDKSVGDTLDYFDKQADSTLAALEKYSSGSDASEFLKNQASMQRDEDYISVSKIANPQAVQMLSQIMNTPAGIELMKSVEGRQQRGQAMKTLTNVLSNVQNGLDTDYNIRDEKGRSQVAGAVEYLGKNAEKDPAAASGLENVVNTVYADSQNQKFNSTQEKYKFYDDYIKALGHPDSRVGVGRLGEIASGKAAENLTEYLSLTLKDFNKDLGAVANKGTEVRMSMLPDGRMSIQTSNQTDTDLLLSKYGMRINNGLRAYANLIGSDTKKAAETLYPQFDALKGLIPQKEGTEGNGKPNATNPLNLTIPGKQGKFQSFDSTEDGIRAASAQLDRYFTGKTPGSGKGLDTLNGIGGLWNNENEKGSASKKDYVGTLSKHMGVPPDQKLDLNNPNVKADLIYAMSVAEGRPVRPSQIIAALGIK